MTQQDAIIERIRAYEDRKWRALRRIYWQHVLGNVMLGVSLCGAVAMLVWGYFY